MTTQSKKANKNPGLMLFLLSIVFIGPMLFAWVVYLKSDQIDFKSHSHGTLITTPTRDAKQLGLETPYAQAYDHTELKGKWWLAYLSPTECNSDCESNLHNMRQMHIALGKDGHRLGRMVITSSPVDHTLSEHFKADYPAMLHTVITPAHYQHQFLPLRPIAFQPPQGEFVIIDPLGQIMMYYPGDTPAKGILSDIKRLLHGSQIG